MLSVTLAYVYRGQVRPVDGIRRLGQLARCGTRTPLGQVLRRGFSPASPFARAVTEQVGTKLALSQHQLEKSQKET